MLARKWRGSLVTLCAFTGIIAVSATNCLAEDNSVTVEEVRQGDAVSLVAQLHNCTEATITVSAVLNNMASSTSLPLTIDTAGKTRVVLTTLSPKDPGKVWTYTWSGSWKYGRRLKQAPTEYAYSLPYRSTAHLVLQGPRGLLSHSAGGPDEEAIDWAMPIGTDVYAARPGTVVALRSDSSVGGPDIKLSQDGNYVVIRHEDGTFAEYLHLDTNGVLVHLGDIVSTHRPIALSGLTGFTTAPHLHFEVFYTIDGATRKSIPVSFQSGSGVYKPLQGTAY